MRSWPADTIAFGGDYNPEQWPRETWDDDLRLMRKAGITFVTLGVFSWSWLEPAPGKYEFGWLDEALDLLAGAGIAVDLATGTASPPPWFSAAYPQTLPVDQAGNRLWPGSRQAWCPSSTIFTEHATALTRQMAMRYHGHPALARWHVSNEYACHNLPCFCDVCAEGFRGWLRQRYGSLDALNEAWGTSFWSQRYTDFEQVLPPRQTTTFGNPTQAWDFWRYGSDALLRQYDAEHAVLQELSPGVAVTTNFMTMEHFKLLDYARWAEHVDVVSTDHYVVHRPQEEATDPRYDPRAEQSFAADLTRGLAGQRPWMLMEHSSSAVNWQTVNEAKPAGTMLLDSLTHIARGADTLGFFQWRQSRAGAEKYHSALLPHAGEDSARFAETVALGQACARLGEVLGSRVAADVALVWDFACGATCDLHAHPSSAIEYGQVAHDLHAALRQAGVGCDVVHVGPDLQERLAGYPVVIVPTLYACSDETAAAIARAAEGGAQVLVTYFSGIVDLDDRVRLGGYPGAFRNLLGIRVEEFFPLPAGRQLGLDDGSVGTLWSEPVAVGEGTEIVTRYCDGLFTGGAAITRRAVGQGAAWYLASRLDPHGSDLLVRRLLAAAGVEALTLPEGVEVVHRVATSAGDDRLWTFVLNHSEQPTDLADVVPGLRGSDLLTSESVDGSSVVGPRSALVVVPLPGSDA